MSRQTSELRVCLSLPWVAQLACMHGLPMPPLHHCSGTRCYVECPSDDARMLRHIRLCATGHWMQQYGGGVLILQDPMYQDRDRRSALNCRAAQLPPSSAVPIVLVAAARCTMTSPSPRTAWWRSSRLPCEAGLAPRLHDLDIRQSERVPSDDCTSLAISSLRLFLLPSLDLE